MGLTVDQLCLRASSLTGLSDAAGSSDRALMDGWVNEGIFKVLQQTQCVVTKVTVTLVAGNDEYAMDRGVLTVLNYGQLASAPSAKISVMNAADMIERKFLQSAGTIRYFAVLGGNILMVSPPPTGNDQFNFWVVPVPDVVATDDELADTGLPTYAERAVECYVNARCFEQSRDYAAVQFWSAEFEKECGLIRIAMRRQAGRTLPAARIGYPDRRSSSASRNDVYPGG